jgi:radical SAM superfamily enzyme YgiQ (UPF0313 family)
MSPKILLVNPWIHDFAAYDLWSKPLGLLYLASLLRLNGIAISLVDCLDPYHPDMLYDPNIRSPKQKPSGAGTFASERIPKPDQLKSIPRNFHRYGISHKAFINTLNSMSSPDAIMVTSMMTYWYPGLFETISILKMNYPGVPIILGGNYVTLCPNHAKLSGADYCLTGPGELSLPPLLKDLLKIDLPLLPSIQNLDSYPYPAFDLLSRRDSVPILTSRGCPYRCSYCGSHLLFERYQRRDPVLVVDEIEYWYARFAIKNFSFYDDALLVNPQDIIIPLLREVIRRRLPVQFHCPNGLHLREIIPEVSMLMNKAGFRTIRFGFESSSEIRQKTTGGKVNNEELRDAVRNLRLAGYQPYDIGIYILCGLPGQSEEEIRESIRFVHSLGARPYLAEFSPIPGSDLWIDAIASSIFPIATDPIFHNNTLLPCRSASLTDEAFHRLKLMTKFPFQASVIQSIDS